MYPFTKAKKMAARLRKSLTIFERHTVLCRDVETLIISYLQQEDLLTDDY